MTPLGSVLAIPLESTLPAYRPNDSGKRSEGSGSGILITEIPITFTPHMKLIAPFSFQH